MSKEVLPPGWAIETLGRACEVLQGQSPPSSAYNSDGRGLPFYQGKTEFGPLYPSPVKWCTEPVKVAHAGDVLISVRAPVGPTNLCRERSCIGRGLAAIRPPAGITSRYLLYALRRQEATIAEQGTGSTFAAISGDVLRSIRLRFAPFAEQERIVAAIEEKFTHLDSAIAALKRVQANLKRYRAVMLHLACKGELVPTEAELARAEGRVYESASVLLKRIQNERRQRENQIADVEVGSEQQNTSELPRLPEGWVWTRIGTVGEVYVGATPSRSQPDYWDGDIPWVSSGEVAFSRIRTTRETISEAGLQNSSTRLHPPGTVLIGMIGEGKTRGQVAILEVEACNNQNCAAIRCPKGQLSSEFVYHFLASQYEANRRVGSGNNQPALNKSRVESFLLPLPPYAEQVRIAAEVERRLSIIQGVETTVEADLHRAERLRQSILKRAFEGKLVAQDPNDEPAGVLLERIRAERAATTPERKVRRGRKQTEPVGASGRPADWQHSSAAEPNEHGSL
ncbi:MAG TPA: restriction endonuclease subunit S [Longimicrobiaceae bacterium]|nr:restriction endonuclease subunit S [Longimicrobiaceae bacterium]